MDHFTIFFLFFGFFIFLFSIFTFSKEDFLLLRKNISLDDFFNLSFVIFFISLFFSRLIFVLENFNPLYLHPLVFLIFPYFPGLSFSGAIFFGFLFFWFLLKRKKRPINRIFDIFSLSFAISFSFQLFVLFLFNLLLKQFTFLIFAFLFLSFLTSVFIWLFQKNKLKDGSIGYLTIAILIISFLIGFFIQNIKLMFFQNKFEFFALILIMILSIFSFIKTEFFS